MQTQGKFALLQLDEIEGWLRQQNITRRVYAVQQHHTWLPNYSNFKDTNHFDLLRGMKNSHLERGFSDIAQHFTTFPDGTIGTGRPLNEIPAGIAGANTYLEIWSKDLWEEEKSISQEQAWQIIESLENH